MNRSCRELEVKPCELRPCGDCVETGAVRKDQRRIGDGIPSVSDRRRSEIGGRLR